MHLRNTSEHREMLHYNVSLSEKGTGCYAGTWQYSLFPGSDRKHLPYGASMG